MLKTNSKFPDLIIRKGSGTLTSGDIKFEASFEICYYPQKTIVETIILDNYIDFKLIEHQSDEWELGGKTDDNIPVKSKSLLLHGINGDQFQHLNKIRNDVAHTGLFRKETPNDILTDFLYNHKTGLQILLLLELGYNGQIESEENKRSK